MLRFVAHNSLQSKERALRPLACILALRDVAFDRIGSNRTTSCRGQDIE
jgi:hypothetical protein